ncbi:MAG: tRNA (adenosine(37)-N6)-threonylcarbamoyltransferase complex dimerization subunit type 1 TsaB [Tissierellia bacterium]|nr:tRNA (adenosine(37)-N6)-threonylcarbamoyltransferase complex dimerization subunit type 1 TsaB [Tissierellia bacterium]
MKVLGIDTSTKTMSIAVIEDSKILCEINFFSNMDHSEKLIDNIKYLLESNNLKMDDIDLVGVAVGPGSFTGIRIGIATAKGLLEFLDIPVVPVSSLEILARNFSSSKTVAVAVDAKRDRVYGAIYYYSIKEVFLEEGLYDITDFSNNMKDKEDLILVGDMCDFFRESFQNTISYGMEGNLLNRASNLCFIALEEYKKGKSISHLNLEANYMSKSQAQIDFEKKNG